VTALKSARYDDAVRLLERVWSVDPDFRDVSSVLSGEYLVRGLEQYAHSDLEGAIAFWTLALKVDPDSHRAQGYLREVRQKQGRIPEKIE
jgi:tetratricopeptide (TPR) repeat protein